jgi:hypothetical protein
MKGIIKGLIVIFAFSSAVAVAQDDTSTISGGWGKRSEYNRKYDPKTTTEIKGEIIKIEEITPVKGMSPGIHILLKKENEETVSVHLGPKWYLDEQDILFKPGDKVEVTGSKITIDYKPAVIAREIKNEKRTLTLRDENGIPEWSGRGRR